MTDEFVHLDASREMGGHVIAQANAAVDADRRLVDDYVTARVGDVPVAAREEITTSWAFRRARWCPSRRVDPP